VLRKEDTDWVKNCTEYEWRGPDQEVDQRGRGERLCKKIAVYLNRGMSWIAVDEKADKIG